MMIRKIGLIVLVSVIYVNISFAQKQRSSSRSQARLAGLYLDNGSILIGELKRESKSEVEVVVKGGSKLTILKSDIKRIKKSSDGYSFNPSGRYNYDKGFYCSFYPLVIFYGSRWPGDGPRSTGSGSQFMIGRHHNKRLSYGSMIGYSYTESYDRESDTPFGFKAVPVTALINYNINLNSSRVYVTSKIGYAFIIESDWYDDIKLGAYGSLGLGTTIASRYLPRFTIELESNFVRTSGDTGRGTYINGEVIYGTFSSIAKYVTIKFGIALRQ